MDEFDIEDEDFEFTKENARKVHLLGIVDDPMLMERWSRIITEIPIESVIALTHGEPRSPMSCPFHGRDRTPSFYIYSRENNCFCFGCPDNTGYYDAVKFTARKRDVKSGRAISWLEKQFGLPPLESQEEDEEEEETEEGGSLSRTLTFHDLSDHFIAKGAAEFLATKNPAIAREYIAMYFDAAPGRDTDPESEEELLKTLPLARVLGSAELERIKKLRFGRIV